MTICIIASGNDIECHMTNQGISKSVEAFWKHRMPMICCKFWCEELSLHFSKYPKAIGYPLLPRFMVVVFLKQVSVECFSNHVTYSDTFAIGSYYVSNFISYRVAGKQKRKKVILPISLNTLRDREVAYYK